MSTNVNIDEIQKNLMEKIKSGASLFENVNKEKLCDSIQKKKAAIKNQQTIQK